MFWNWFRKKKTVAPTIISAPKLSSAHPDFVTATSTVAADEALLKQFLDEHKNFEDYNYRKGAAFTAQFGIEAGWGEDFTPGYVRIHPGTDRARGGSITHGNTIINDVVICPMNFDSSAFIDYKGASYGSLVILRNKKYQFEMRIAHMHPVKDIITWSLEQFRAGKPFQQNWIIGKAGTYGYSTGNHTHTELLSLDESCEIFELLLHKQFGDEVDKEYTEQVITNFYKQQAKDYPKTSPFVGWTDAQILRHWMALRKDKAVIFINQYKYTFASGSKIYTRYASNKVLKGL